jgi:uncharacterized DUF497 family protein
MEFEFDPVKSASNLRKHGIDFADAGRSGRTRTGSRSRPDPSTSRECR